MIAETKPLSDPIVDGRAARMTGWLLVATLACTLLLPLVTRRGVFLDGLIYASIARNLAVGTGDLTHPVFAGDLREFREHPPLAMWLESWAFRMLGDHWWVEKLYSVLTALLTAGLIVQTWRWLMPDGDQRRYLSWLPIALWISVPCWQWSVGNNLLENTLGIFTATSVYCSLRSLGGNRGQIAWVGGAALALVGAALVKGPAGLFPLITPIVAGLCFRRPLRVVLGAQCLLLSLVVAAVGALLLRPDCYDFFATYFEQQVIASLKGQREVNPSMFGQANILRVTFLNLLPALAISAVVNWLARRKHQGPPVARDISLRPAALFCLATGLSASCPWVLSPKQTGFYIMPAYPYFALACALWSVDSVWHIISSLGMAPMSVLVHRRLRMAAGATLTLLLGLSCLWYGKPRRDIELLSDVDLLGQAVPRQSLIEISQDLVKHWTMQAYLQRQFCIDVDHVRLGREYRLELNDGAPVPGGYAQVSIGLNRYRLLRSTHLAPLERREEGHAILADNDALPDSWGQNGD